MPSWVPTAGTRSSTPRGTSVAPSGPGPTAGTASPCRPGTPRSCCSSSLRVTTTRTRTNEGRRISSSPETPRLPATTTPSGGATPGSSTSAGTTAGRWRMRWFLSWQPTLRSSRRTPPNRTDPAKRSSPCLWTAGSSSAMWGAPTLTSKPPTMSSSMNPASTRTPSDRSRGIQENRVASTRPPIRRSPGRSRGPRGNRAASASRMKVERRP